jgi:hypothetical protein
MSSRPSSQAENLGAKSWAELRQLIRLLWSETRSADLAKNDDG